MCLGTNSNAEKKTGETGENLMKICNGLLSFPKAVYIKPIHLNDK